MTKKIETEMYEDEFRQAVINISDNTQWSDFVSQNYTYSDWIAMGISKRKQLFEEYISEEADLDDLINQYYWEGVFIEEPFVLEKEHGNYVVGVLDEDL